MGTGIMSRTGCSDLPWGAAVAQAAPSAAVSSAMHTNCAAPAATMG
jgi:hypothetical protein